MTEIAERIPTTGERIAEQTLIAFSQNPTQEPISTFTSESDGKLDMTTYQSGTIIRLEHLEKPTKPMEPVRGPEYIWYVVGDRFVNPQSGEEEVMVYDFMLSKDNRSNPKLQKIDRASLFGSNPVRLQSYSVKDAKVALEGRNLVSEGEPYRDAFPVTRVDIMAQGVDLEKTQPVQIPSSRRRLN